MDYLSNGNTRAGPALWWFFSAVLDVSMYSERGPGRALYGVHASFTHPRRRYIFGLIAWIGSQPTTSFGVK